MKLEIEETVAALDRMLLPEEPTSPAGEEVTLRVDALREVVPAPVTEPLTLIVPAPVSWKVLPVVAEEALRATVEAESLR